MESARDFLLLRLLTQALSLLLIGAFSCSGPTKKTARELSEDGIALCKSGDTNKGIKLLDEATRLDPTIVEGWIDMGCILCEQKNFEKAMLCYDKALRLVRNDSESSAAQSGKYSKKEVMNRALSCVNHVIDVDDSIGEAWHLKGSILVRAQKMEDAMACLSKASILSPGSDSIWVSKGGVHFLCEEYKEALVCYDKAIQLNADNIEAWRAKGMVLGRVFRDYSGSLSCFDRALEIDATSAVDLRFKAGILSVLGRFSESAEVYRRLLDVAPDDVDAWRGLGVAWGNEGEHANALTAFERALEVDAQCVDCWIGKGKALSGLKRPEEALQSFEKALSIDKDSANAWCCLGVALYSTGRLEQARRALERACKLGSEEAKTAIEMLSADRDSTGYAGAHHPDGKEKVCAGTLALDVSRYGMPFLVDVEIGPKENEILCLLDTGATSNALDESFRDQLGNPLETKRLSTPAGEKAVDLFESPSLKVGSLSVGTPRIACVDLTTARLCLGQRLDGIIGLPGLERFSLCIDFGAGKLSLSADGPEPSGGYERIELSRREDGFYFLMSVGNRRFSVLIDTGYNAEMTVGRELFQRLVENRIIVVSGSDAVLSVNGSYTSRFGTMSSASIGDLGIESMSVIESSGGADVGVGIGFLERFDVILDFPREVMWLRPREPFVRSMPYRILGMLPLFTPSGIVVDTILDDGRAARAGLARMDLITKIDDRNTCDLDLKSFTDLLVEWRGRRVNLSIKRDEKEIQLFVELSKN